MSGLLRISLCPGCFGDAEWTRTVGLVRTRCPSCGERSWPGLKRLGQLSERAALNGYLYPYSWPSAARPNVISWRRMNPSMAAPEPHRRAMTGVPYYHLSKAALGKITNRKKKSAVVANGSTDVNSGRIVIGREVQLRVTWSDGELEEFVRCLWRGTTRSDRAR